MKVVMKINAAGMLVAVYVKEGRGTGCLPQTSGLMTKLTGKKADPDDDATQLLPEYYQADVGIKGLINTGGSNS